MSTPIRVVVLGSTGMLGRAVTAILSGMSEFDVTGTVRNLQDPVLLGVFKPSVKLVEFDVERAVADSAEFDRLPQCDFVINCIGVIKSQIDESIESDVKRAYTVNADFPQKLSEWTLRFGAQVLQIATDCVYTGSRGRYGESTAHDATDVYGVTKSKGEITASHFHNIRCSIIGPEIRTHKSLLDWFTRHPLNATTTGYVNHRWNGVTAVQFAHLCAGVMKSGMKLPSLVHVTPANEVTKCELLELMGKHMNRPDIKINPVNARDVVDRTLVSENPVLNAQIWQAAGYDMLPTMEQMVAELAAWMNLKH